MRIFGTEQIKDSPIKPSALQNLQNQENEEKSILQKQAPTLFEARKKNKTS